MLEENRADPFSETQVNGSVRDNPSSGGSSELLSSLVSLSLLYYAATLVWTEQGQEDGEVETFAVPKREGNDFTLERGGTGAVKSQAGWREGSGKLAAAWAPRATEYSPDHWRV
ncbi:hypothetical protein SKAU_G00006030 [Synaphobranchus kaupii]|uniref:Uncharacterized protein n=1 Tax=Synaphobranchus kaupii TaxID=118154 RepID=A0A9Q1GA56_SYNKA|nr:hypothetical protein SKAU_G00006030 [Synaphobranchus kaupii]